MRPPKFAVIKSMKRKIIIKMFTSHLALETEAAAPNRAAEKGNTIAIRHCSCGKFWINGSVSTTAAEAAADKPARAEVNGKIEPARLP